MQSWADKQVTTLRATYGDRFDIWFVPRYPTGQTWHARPAGTEIAAVNAESPADLAQAIEDYEARKGGNTNDEKEEDDHRGGGGSRHDPGSGLRGRHARTRHWFQWT